MGRAVKEAHITTRNARGKLPVSKAAHWRAIDRGTHLGYRKGKNGGTWIVRLRKDDRTYVTHAIGAADDRSEADDEVVLDFSQALAKAQKWCRDYAHAETGTKQVGPYKVADAIRDYMDWFRSHRKSSDQTQSVINAHILPEFGNVTVSKLNPLRIRKWHEALAKTPPRLRSRQGSPIKYRDISNDHDGFRKRKASANKALNILKAALNKAYQDGCVASDDGWRRVKPFRNVDEAIVRYLSNNESKRLINACDPDFRQLVKAALLTGCRYGELIVMLCSDFNIESGTAFIRESKSGKPRSVPLNDEGIEYFSSMTVGKCKDGLIFTRVDGKPWGRSHQRRRLNDAAERVGISEVSFHILRHTYGSALAMQGVPMAVIAAVLGHSDTRMTEKHYAKLAPNYVAETIRAHLPKLGVGKETNVESITTT